MNKKLGKLMMEEAAKGLAGMSFFARQPSNVGSKEISDLISAASRMPERVGAQAESAVVVICDHRTNQLYTPPPYKQPGSLVVCGVCGRSETRYHTARFAMTRNNEHYAVGSFQSQ